MVNLLAGCLLVVFGYLIRFRQMVNLIAGYNSEKVTGSEGLGRLVGTGLLILGLLGLCTSAITLAYPANRITISLGYGLGAIPVGCLVIALGARKFKRPE